MFELIYLSNNPVNRSHCMNYCELSSRIHVREQRLSLKRALTGDVYCGFSPAEKLYIDQHLREDAKKFKFVMTGAPHNDRLHKFLGMSEVDRLSIKKKQLLKLGLDGDKKTILISSHWSSSGNLRKFGGSIVEAICYNFPHHQVAASCHPKLWSNPQDEYSVVNGGLTPI
ncbi:MAG: hypothetical protein U1F47_04000 [Hyphomicrobiales bacterium]